MLKGRVPVSQTHFVESVHSDFMMICIYLVGLTVNREDTVNAVRSFVYTFHNGHFRAIYLYDLSQMSLDIVCLKLGALLTEH